MGRAASSRKIGGFKSSPTIGCKRTYSNVDDKSETNINVQLIETTATTTVMADDHDHHHHHHHHHPDSPNR
jgi:hypothetical protein